MTRSSIRASIFAVLVPLAVAACGGAKPTTHEASKEAAAGEPRAVCVSAFERQRTCADVFIPALVGARVEADNPPGIAAADASEGRAALVAKANEEWATDSTDEAIGQHCDGMVAKVPADQLGALADAVEGCVAAADCDGFTSCMIPIMQAQWHQGPHE